MWIRQFCIQTVLLRENKFKITSQFLVKTKIVYFASLLLRNIAVCPAWSILSVKLIYCIALEQHQVLLIYLNLLLLSYSIFWNKNNWPNKQLYNHVFDQLQSFECFSMFSYRFLLVDQKAKRFIPSVITLWCFTSIVGRKCLVRTALNALFSNDTTK